MMYSFRNDYSEGAHPSILKAMSDENLNQKIGYGMDEICEQARSLIRKECNAEQADVHFLVGGTQANLTVIAAALRPYEAVIACESGHINVHETGSIEACGHKVCTAYAKDGKLTPVMIQKIVDFHADEHMVKPKMVYISNATELGTIYYKEELTALHKICKELDLYLFMDGARLGSALTAEGNDLTLADIAKLCDVFYIGGTKNGALFGEAVVINHEQIKKEFRYNIKQRGGMLAKGFLLGLQFKSLFENDLFYSLAKHANECAQRMVTVIKDTGFEFYADSPTNQLFPILPNSLADKISEKYAFQVHEKINDETSALRFVTSWACPDHIIDEFINDFKSYTEQAK